MKLSALFLPFLCLSVVAAALNDTIDLWLTLATLGAAGSVVLLMVLREAFRSFMFWLEMLAMDRDAPRRALEYAARHQQLPPTIPIPPTVSMEKTDD